MLSVFSLFTYCGSSHSHHPFFKYMFYLLSPKHYFTLFCYLLHSFFTSLLLTFFYSIIVKLFLQLFPFVIKKLAFYWSLNCRGLCQCIMIMWLCAVGKERFIVTISQLNIRSLISFIFIFISSTVFCFNQEVLAG